MINHNVLELLNCDIDFLGGRVVEKEEEEGINCVENFPDLRLLNVAAHMAVEKVQ